MPGDADKAARKVRRTAEAESSKHASKEKARQLEPESADAHNELTHPRHSKGRPAPDEHHEKGSTSGRSRGSNAGNDGP